MAIAARTPAFTSSIDVGAGDKADADVGGDKTLEQFAGVQFHGDPGLEATLFEEIFDRIAGASDFGKKQRERDHISNADLDPCGRVHGQAER